MIQQSLSVQKYCLKSPSLCIASILYETGLNQQDIWEYHWNTHKMTNMTTPYSKVHFSISYFLLNQEFINKSGSFRKQEKLQLLYLHFQIIDSKIPSVILWASNSFNLWVAVNTFSPHYCWWGRTARQTDSRMYEWTNRWTSPHLTGHTTDYEATPLHHHKANFNGDLASHKLNIHRTSLITSCTSINNHVRLFRCCCFFFKIIWLLQCGSRMQNTLNMLNKLLKLQLFILLKWFNLKFLCF